MFNLRIFVILLLIWPFFISCGPAGIEANNKVEGSARTLLMRKVQYSTPVKSNFRGLCLVNKSVVWASGSNGTYIRTIDGGANWTIDKVPGAEEFDFRDVEAFNQDTALLISAGFPGKIYKTTDGGKTWAERYSNLDSAVFFNGFDFWDDRRGIAFGDPLGSKLLIIRTIDGGDSWQQIDTGVIPTKLPVEAGFAASGTGIVTLSTNKLLIGLGGSAARVFLSTDLGNSWEAVTTTIIAGSSSRGIYSMAFRNELEGIAVGGAWNEDSLKMTSAYTIDGGRSWTSGKGMEAYRSGSCYAGNNTYLATGPSGTDITKDGGKTWERIDESGMNAIAFDIDEKTGYAVGGGGQLFRFELEIPAK